MGNIIKAGRESERHLYGGKQEGKYRSSKIECAGNGRGVLKELQTLKEEHNIYRIGKARDKSINDFMEWFYGNRISWNGGLIATGQGLSSNLVIEQVLMRITKSTGRLTKDGGMCESERTQ